MADDKIRSIEQQLSEMKESFRATNFSDDEKGSKTRQDFAQLIAELDKLSANLREISKDFD